MGARALCRNRRQALWRIVRHHYLTIDQVISNAAVNDGQWHTVALVFDGTAQTMSLYLDGQLIGSVSGSPQDIDGSFNQVGTGYTDYWPATPGGWYGFQGEITTSASGTYRDRPTRSRRTCVISSKQRFSWSGG